jgi:hypothetical protein
MPPVILRTKIFPLRRFLVMKRFCLAGVLTMLSVGLMSASRAAADAIAPFVSSQTDAVIYVDLSSIDMDALTALQQKILSQLPPDQAEQAKQKQAQTDKQMAQARQWLDGFKKAGGKDIYIVVQLSGLFQGKPGALLVPLQPGVDSAVLAKFLYPAAGAPPDPNVPASPMQPKTEVIGQMLVFAPGPMIDDFKAGSAQPRPDLSDGLAAAGDAPVRIVLIPTSLKRSPMLGMFTAGMGGRGGQPGGPPAGPMSEPEWNNVTWIAVSGSLPPKESGNFTCQCKDADSANAMADLINKKMEERKNNPQTQQMGADADKLAAALKPTVDGTKVVINLDQDTVDNILIPIMVKAAGRNGGGPGPGAAPGAAPAPPPENNGGGMQQ